MLMMTVKMGMIVVVLVLMMVKDDEEYVWTIENPNDKARENVIEWRSGQTNWTILTRADEMIEKRGQSDRK
jgi:ABC-type transport system involved in cytochrome bd biosynthesis fused ATPase/permease subunit